MKPIHLIPWLAVLATASAAHAKPPEGKRPPPPPPAIFLLDTDKDGTISEDELAAAGDTLLKLDENADGSVSLEEFLPPPPPGKGGPDDEDGDRPLPPAPPLFKLLDADKDGSLSGDELAAVPEVIGKKFDKNGDGKISKKELRPKPPKRKKDAEEDDEDSEDDGGRPPGPPPGGRPPRR